MKLFFAGDVLLKDESYINRLLSKELQKIVNEHDIVCCNLEGPYIEKTDTVLSKRGPSVFQGRSTLRRLNESGFNTLILANNHIMDYGIDGLKTTLENIKGRFYCTGAGEDETSVYKILKIEIEGVIVGILAIAECAFGSSIGGNGGCAWMAHENVREMFQEAREQCDYFFVVCHCGAEELEVPLPEIKNIYRSFIDQGATAVIGHHPHVIQGSEEYKGRKIYYSLGNFAFDSLENPSVAYQPIGLCVSIEIMKDGAIQYEQFLTEYSEGQVALNFQNREWNRVNEFLKDEREYKSLVDNYCIELFENYFKKYILNVIGLDIENKERCRKFANYRLLGEPLRWDYLFLYHNIAIETNRWVCIHAIRMLEHL